MLQAWRCLVPSSSYRIGKAIPSWLLRLRSNRFLTDPNPRRLEPGYSSPTLRRSSQQGKCWRWPLGTHSCSPSIDSCSGSVQLAQWAYSTPRIGNPVPPVSRSRFHLSGTCRFACYFRVSTVCKVRTLLPLVERLLSHTKALGKDTGRLVAGRNLDTYGGGDAGVLVQGIHNTVTLLGGLQRLHQLLPECSGHEERI